MTGREQETQVKVTQTEKENNDKDTETETEGRKGGGGRRKGGEEEIIIAENRFGKLRKIMAEGNRGLKDMIGMRQERKSNC